MHKLKSLLPQQLKNAYHLLKAIFANVRFGFPARKLKVIGITGTNGKTTTTQMVTKILEEAGKKVAMASTINFRINGQEEINRTKFTTLSAYSVQKFIKRATEAGSEYLVLETSSHALDQYRVWGIKYACAVITNVTREHLDYHKTMENYREAKKRIFADVGTAIVNLDMENPDQYLNETATRKIGYTLKATENPKVNELVVAKNLELGIEESKFEVNGQNYSLKLIGDFNVENALAAIAVGVNEGISGEVISRALLKIEGVPGRLEKIPNDRNLNIIVDFALTPDALERLYQLIQKVNIAKGNVIAVFGSCGERDRGKRPIMGEIVSDYADYIILTNDEPYHENPQQIIEEIAAGIKNQEEGINYWKIEDRRQAIRKALEISKPNDIVLVTGMGAEDTMAIGDERIPWNDRQVILEELEKLN
jgi:UDP-N-acetylmuramoyl-L-alanyl-D-glutamate--2,6-diaminopimelate ligase